MLVFRESAGRARFPSATLIRELDSFLRSATSNHGERHELLTNALLRAGEIECALADLRHPAASAAESLSEEIARELLLREADYPSAFARLAAQHLPESLTTTTPEGFAYYALDPLRYPETIREFNSGPSFVVGIRSVGTVLSAVSAAALRCGRMTVRPTGHPYDRELRLTPEQLAVVRRQVDGGARFFVVDEGPGLSGSSFLATAEALERKGVSRERITLIGSHDCDGANLVAQDAEARWNRYRFVAVSPASAPEGARPFRDWDWRRESQIGEKDWPATWSQLTPPKYISASGDLLWKYEGLGRAGDQVRARAHALADRRFSPRLSNFARGFSAYQYVPGEALRSAEWSADLAGCLAEYLVFRRSEFAADSDAAALHQMVIHNVRALLGVDLVGYRLDVVSACICDARLMPHEWIRSEDRILKADATMHGDDHFYPGPCDIAWDVAGAIIDWQLQDASAADFISRYERLSGDNVRRRLPQYRIAYAAFRAAYASMAASAMPGTPEAGRFARACHRYKDVLRSEVQPFLPAKKVYA